jgi:hypothetical protein
MLPCDITNVTFASNHSIAAKTDEKAKIWLEMENYCHHCVKQCQVGVELLLNRFPLNLKDLALTRTVKREVGT